MVLASFMPGIGLILQICLVLFGAYGLYTWFHIEHWSEVPGNKFLYPQGNPMENSKEPEEFKKFIKPRMLIFSLVSLASGGLSLLNTYVLWNNQIVEMLLALIGFGGLMFYVVSISQASKRFM